MSLSGSKHQTRTLGHAGKCLVYLGFVVFLFCPGTQFVAQAGLELKELASLYSGALGLKVSATIPSAGKCFITSN